jgi:hypothetical protein
MLADHKLKPGYAQQSSRRRPRQPETVVVGSDECTLAKCVGSAVIDGRAGWLAFKIPGKRRYYFQYCPW